ncbi:hypothetical protein BV898_02153 [Hypsibius exemplaris]|uniref:KxDL domain-containing protein n=1 Tax=Hypsibius exemplaris TaxID=2072580 RepID=A0A1W0X9K6_HYPEX|nr:hypothetical protein BV898_02153 [Hypsibius exemplaris]
MSGEKESPTASSHSEASAESSGSSSSGSSSDGWMDESRLSAILHDQREMLGKLEKANETLETCNILSFQRLEAYTPDFKNHVKLLVDMKKDLDSVYKRLRIVQTKVARLYPANYADAVSKAEMNEEEEAED